MRKRFTKRKERYLYALAAFLTFSNERFENPTHLSSQEFSFRLNQFLKATIPDLRNAPTKLTKSNLELVHTPAFKSVLEFKKYLIKELKKGEIIAFPFAIGCGHWDIILLVGHCLWDEVLYAECDPSVFGPHDGKDLFITINGYHDVCAWSDLSQNLLSPDGEPDNGLVSHNKEGYSFLANFCMKGTKIIKGIPE